MLEGARGSGVAAFMKQKNRHTEQPELAPYHFLLGNLYASQMLSSLATAEDRACFLLAESEYFEAIRLDAGEHRYRINLGNLYFRNGSYREAWTRYSEALDLAETFPHHYHAPPDIKHNRLPAPGMSFQAPNLPVLVDECGRLGDLSETNG